MRPNTFCLALPSAIFGAILMTSASAGVPLASPYTDFVDDQLLKRLSMQIDGDYGDYDKLDQAAAARWQQAPATGLHANLRDHEYLEHSSLSGDGGFQYISGGAGEGVQHLTPDGSQPNIHKVISDDVLPFYCHPPNPCPKGFTEKDGCTLAVADTADVQKEWMASMQDQGMCSCDEEHMFSCGKEDQDEDPVSNNELRDVIQSLLHDKEDNPYSSGGQRLNVVAKKSPRVKRNVNDLEKELQRMKMHQMRLNPYLHGPKLATVAKKGNILKN